MSEQETKRNYDECGKTSQPPKPSGIPGVAESPMPSENLLDFLDRVEVKSPMQPGSTHPRDFLLQMVAELEQNLLDRLEAVRALRRLYQFMDRREAQTAYEIQNALGRLNYPR